MFGKSSRSTADKSQWWRSATVIAADGSNKEQVPSDMGPREGQAAVFTSPRILGHFPPTLEAQEEDASCLSELEPKPSAAGVARAASSVMATDVEEIKGQPTLVATSSLSMQAGTKIVFRKLEALWPKCRDRVESPAVQDKLHALLHLFFWLPLQWLLNSSQKRPMPGDGQVNAVGKGVMSAVSSLVDASWNAVQPMDLHLLRECSSMDKPWTRFSFADMFLVLRPAQLSKTSLSMERDMAGIVYDEWRSLWEMSTLSNGAATLHSLPMADARGQEVKSTLASAISSASPSMTSPHSTPTEPLPLMHQFAWPRPLDRVINGVLLADLLVESFPDRSWSLLIHPDSVWVRDDSVSTAHTSFVYDLTRSCLGGKSLESRVLSAEFCRDLVVRSCSLQSSSASPTTALYQFPLPTVMEQWFAVRTMLKL
jgi:hypothetical protein